MEKIYTTPYGETKIKRVYQNQQIDPDNKMDDLISDKNLIADFGDEGKLYKDAYVYKNNRGTMSIESYEQTMRDMTKIGQDYIKEYADYGKEYADNNIHNKLKGYSYSIDLGDTRKKQGSDKNENQYEGIGLTLKVEGNKVGYEIPMEYNDADEQYSYFVDNYQDSIKKSNK